MAFFDEMKQKVSQVGQSASKSAKEFSETSRLNSEITAAKNKINQLYNQIGYTVYCAYSENPLPEAANLIEQVNALHDQIGYCQAQIQALNASSRCSNCGAKIRPGMAFCSSCGIRLPQPELTKPAAQSFCPNCGSPVTGDTAFCPNCGFRVQEAAAPVAVVSVQPNAIVQPPAPQVAQPMVCPGCGEPIPVDATFCINCGTKLN